MAFRLTLRDEVPSASTESVTQLQRDQTHPRDVPLAVTQRMERNADFQARRGFTAHRLKNIHDRRCVPIESRIAFQRLIR